MSFETTHGLKGNRLYRIHHNMKQRCYNPNNTHWFNYGGRGIKICDEWISYDHENKINTGFLNFYNWAMNNGYADDLTVDRIDPNANYSPDNCRWVDRKFQSNNRNDNHYLLYQGYNFTLSIWSEITKINYPMITDRVRKKWTTEEILRTPAGNRRGDGYLCWQVSPEYLKYHNPDTTRIQTNSVRGPLPLEVRKKLSECNKNKPNYADRVLDELQLYIIRLLHAEGYSDRKIGKIFEIDHSTINRILNGKAYVTNEYTVEELLEYMQSKALHEELTQRIIEG